MIGPRDIDIVFDGPPGNESGRFIEVESPPGVGISFGTWLQREDGYWVLRFTVPNDGLTISTVLVPFKMHAPGGFTVHHVECAKAPTLTASAFAIKAAAHVEASRELYFYMDSHGGDRRIGDAEAVVLQLDGSTQFIVLPQARW